MRVFISYNHSDKYFVSSLEKSLEEKQIDYFLDEKNISYGDSISKSVKNAFDSITHLVVVISPGSDKSHWVSFEIGMALGRGLKVIPIVAHPAMDLPPFIGDLKYFKSIEEFDSHFHKLSLNTLNIDVSVDLLHSQDLGALHEDFEGHTGYRKFEVGDELDLNDDTWEPAIRLEIINRTGRTIELKSPMIEFKRPQAGIAEDTEITAIGFMPMTPKELIAGGKIEYSHFGKVCRGTTIALIEDNIQCISIKTTDSFNYKINSTVLSEHKEYAERYFSHLWRNKGEQSAGEGPGLLRGLFGGAWFRKI